MKALIMAICVLVSCAVFSQNDNNYHGPLGHGTGYYQKEVDGPKIPFTWNSYTNNDGWLQADISITLKETDLQVIRNFRDQLGRDHVWQAKAENRSTWIGMSNDFTIGDLEKRYSHNGKSFKLPNGGTSAPIYYHYRLLKKDYLDRMTNALDGRLVFHVAEIR